MKITKDLHKCINQEITDNNHHRNFEELYYMLCQDAYNLERQTGSMIKFSGAGITQERGNVLNYKLAREKAEVDYILDILTERIKIALKVE